MNSEFGNNHFSTFGRQQKQQQQYKIIIINYIYIKKKKKKKKNAGQRAKLAARPPGILPVLPMASPPLCICVLTVACNHAIQHLFFKLANRCKKIKLNKKTSGSGSKFNCAARVGSDDLGYGPGSGFSLKPVQTSTANVSAV